MIYGTPVPHSCCVTRTVMKVLGRSQIGPMMNTYAHVLPEVERAR